MNVEDAFVHWWQVGNVGEDWDAWTDLFVDDVVYTEHFWGTLHGRDEIRVWINAVMKGVPEIYTVLEWYVIDGDIVVFKCQNRRDNPGVEGPPYFDFAGLTALHYAGDGRWRSEEDYWDVSGARRTSAAYAEACARTGATREQRMTRRHWPETPAWARGPEVPSPSWLRRPDLPGITRPSELAGLIPRLASTA